MGKWGNLRLTSVFVGLSLLSCHSPDQVERPELLEIRGTVEAALGAMKPCDPEKLMSLYTIAKRKYLETKNAEMAGALSVGLAALPGGSKVAVPKAGLISIMCKRFELAGITRDNVSVQGFDASADGKTARVSLRVRDRDASIEVAREDGEWRLMTLSDPIAGQFVEDASAGFAVSQELIHPGLAYTRPLDVLKQAVAATQPCIPSRIEELTTARVRDVRVYDVLARTACETFMKQRESDPVSISQACGVLVGADDGAKGFLCRSIQIAGINPDALSQSNLKESEVGYDGARVTGTIGTNVVNAKFVWDEAQLQWKLDQPLALFGSLCRSITNVGCAIELLPEKGIEAVGLEFVAHLEAAAGPRPFLKVGSWRVYRDPGSQYSEIEGEVKNVSGTKLKSVDAVASYYTADGSFITSGSALIDYNPILADQTSPFKTMTRFNPAMASVKLEFRELGGGLLPTSGAGEKRALP